MPWLCFLLSLAPSYIQSGSPSNIYLISQSAPALLLGPVPRLSVHLFHHNRLSTIGSLVLLWFFLRLPLSAWLPKARPVPNFGLFFLFPALVCCLPKHYYANLAGTTRECMTGTPGHCVCCRKYLYIDIHIYTTASEFLGCVLPIPRARAGFSLCDAEDRHTHTYAYIRNYAHIHAGTQARTERIAGTQSKPRP
jgi:hypothetical protein